MRTFTINGKRYKAAPFTYNTVCEIEENGVSISQMREKPMSMVRAYFAVCLGGDKTQAGEEINAHVVGGGALDELYSVMADEMNDSDFFQALSKNADKEAPEVQSEEKKSKA